MWKHNESGLPIPPMVLLFEPEAAQRWTRPRTKRVRGRIGRIPGSIHIESCIWNEFRSKIRPCPWMCFCIASNNRRIVQNRIDVDQQPNVDTQPSQPRADARADEIGSSGNGDVEIKTALFPVHLRELAPSVRPSIRVRTSPTNWSRCRKITPAASLSFWRFRGDLRHPRRILQDRRDPRGEDGCDQADWLPDDRRSVGLTASAASPTVQCHRPGG